MLKPRLVLAANAIPGVGGQGQNLLHMLQAYRDPFETSVFCRGDRAGLPGRTVPASRLAGWIGSVPIVRRRADWITLANDLQFDGSVARHLPRAQLFQGVVGQSTLSFMAARLKGVRRVLDVVNTHIDDLSQEVERECAVLGTTSFISASMKRRIHAEYAGADLIRVMSDYAKQTFVERGISSDRVVVATPPVDLDEFPPAEFRHNCFRVCFVGLLQPWKGFHYLIEAFNRAAIADSELVLWGGSGSRTVSKYLAEKRAENRAIQVRPEEVRRVGYGAVYGTSSVLVHPSLTDGFGYVVAEAMASGIPVIVSRGAGSADLVVDGENGYVIPPRDSVAIEERLRHLAKNPALLRQMGGAARATAQGLTLERFRSQIVARMKELV